MKKNFYALYNKKAKFYNLKPQEVLIGTETPKDMEEGTFRFLAMQNETTRNNYQNWQVHKLFEIDDETGKITKNDPVLVFDYNDAIATLNEQEEKNGSHNETTKSKANS